MKWFWEFIGRLWKDKTPAWELARERKFIEAVNNLKTLTVTDRGGMAIDPEEIRDRIIASRRENSQFVHRAPHPAPQTRIHPQSTSKSEAPKLKADQVRDYLEIVTWRRLASGACVRYVCLESLTTKQYAVATADLFSEPIDSLFEGLTAKINHRVAAVIGAGELEWFDSAEEAMDAFDKGI